MAAPLSDQQVQTLRQQLLDDYAQLRETVHEELLRCSTDDRFIDLAGRVHDPGEESIADLLADLDLEIVRKHTAQLQAIETALQCIELGTYGRCIECDTAIEYERLRVYPTAKRCLDCQQRYERNSQGGNTPTL